MRLLQPVAYQDGDTYASNWEDRYQAALNDKDNDDCYVPYLFNRGAIRQEDEDLTRTRVGK